VPIQTAPAQKKAPCPTCSATGRLVERRTLLQQLKNPHQALPPKEPFYFCAETACDTVYFSLTGITYERDSLRLPVGQKSTDPGRLVCYCFDVTAGRVEEELAQSGESATQAFVMAQVKDKTCSCDVRNPSGRCCLIDFPTRQETNS